MHLLKRFICYVTDKIHTALIFFFSNETVYVHSSMNLWKSKPGKQQLQHFSGTYIIMEQNALFIVINETMLLFCDK